LEPSLALANDLPRRVAAFEIDLEKLFATAPESIQATPIYTYPAATQDLSLIVGRDLAAGEVLALISASAGELLEDVRLVDDYRGENVSVDKKSLTFALRFRAADRTLTQVEASEARNAAVAAAVQKFGAEIRA
jgi:phenylalanyl-tRNA synthetase beta chain